LFFCAVVLQRGCEADEGLLMVYERRQEYLLSIQSLEERDEEQKAFILRELSLIDEKNRSENVCCGCGARYRGTKLWCLFCPEFVYCEKCALVDPKCHSLSHWLSENNQHVCSCCKQTGVARCENVVYCDDCLASDKGGFIASQWLFEHVEVQEPDIRSMRSKLGVSTNKLMSLIRCCRFP
jgi:hypothetical protein